MEDALRGQLDAVDLALRAYRLTGTTARVSVVNRRYASNRAGGGPSRPGRWPAPLPGSVERFEIVPLGRGHGRPRRPRSSCGGPTSRRSRTGRTGRPPSWTRPAWWTRRPLEEDGLVVPEGTVPRFTWSLSPYSTTSTFDPDNPLRIDLGVQLGATWEPVPGVRASGTLRQKLIGNRDEADRPSNSVLPRVRTDSYLFARQEGVFVNDLTLAWIFRPAPDVYGRVTGGLLESQYGGVSAELLWQRPDSPLGIGVEYNRVRQRDFDMRFGFRDLDASTGHVSAYYEWPRGYRSELHVGQYLAGDRGATLDLSRRFENGWVAGAFATKTDVSADEFGEGSFDKGIYLRVPINYVIGRPSRDARRIVLRPVLRDGGGAAQRPGPASRRGPRPHRTGPDRRLGAVLAMTVPVRPLLAAILLAATVAGCSNETAEEDRAPILDAVLARIIARSPDVPDARDVVTAQALEAAGVPVLLSVPRRTGQGTTLIPVAANLGTVQCDRRPPARGS